MKRLAAIIAGITLTALTLQAQENLIPNAAFTQLAKNGLPSQWSGQCWKDGKGAFVFDAKEKAIQMTKTNGEGLTLVITEFTVAEPQPCEVTVSFEIMIPSPTAGTVVCKRDDASGKTIFYQEILKFTAMSDWKTVTATVKSPSSGKINLSFRLTQPGELLIRNVVANIKR